MCLKQQGHRILLTVFLLTWAISSGFLPLNLKANHTFFKDTKMLEKGAIDEKNQGHLEGY